MADAVWVFGGYEGRTVVHFAHRPKYGKKIWPKSKVREKYPHQPSSAVGIHRIKFRGKLELRIFELKNWYKNFAEVDVPKMSTSANAGYSEVFIWKNRCY